MLIIAAAPDVNVQKFIELIGQSTCEFTVKTFYEWQNTNVTIDGFVYIKVIPEITINRIKHTNKEITLEQIQTTHDFLNNYFITKTAMPQELHSIPVLILNGFVDFEADFSQFYNHLFYIKKFFNEIKTKKDKEKGIYVAPKKHSGCKC